jgi:hypothetical protein
VNDEEANEASDDATRTRKTDNYHNDDDKDDTAEDT